MGDSSDEEYNDAGMLNEPKGVNLKPVLHNEQLPSGKINTNSTPLPIALKKIEDETIEEKGETAEGQTILESKTEESSILGSIGGAISSVGGAIHSRLDYDGDGVVEFSDGGKAVGDGVLYTTGVIKEATGANALAQGVERQTQNLIMMVGVVGLAYLLIKG